MTRILYFSGGDRGLLKGLLPSVIIKVEKKNCAPKKSQLLEKNGRHRAPKRGDRRNLLRRGNDRRWQEKNERRLGTKLVWIKGVKPRRLSRYSP